MNFGRILATGVLIVCGLCLALFNPTFADFEHIILMPRAGQVAARSASLDRQAIQQETTRISIQWAAPHFDPKRLDVDQFQLENPILGSSVIRLSTQGLFVDAFREARQHAFARVEATKQDLYFSMLADLASHTGHVSYGLWGIFTTCLETQEDRYIGLAGRFYRLKGSDSGSCRDHAT